MSGDRFKTLVQPVEADLNLFDQRLAACMAGDSPLITSIAKHLMKNRGKRIRPVMLFLSARASEFFNQHIVESSLAIELIHTATLLHDDVVDNADKRRGVETVNFKWTNLISVLMGDYLLAKAMRLIMNLESSEFIKAIGEVTERISIGELRQVEETANYDLSEEEYLKIIADKTASLFSISCAAGPILSGKNGKIKESFAYFGEKFGLAFQITDDLLDYVGDVVETGKEPGNDITTGKVTLPLIYSLRHGEKGKSREIMKLLGNGVDKGEFKTVLRYVVESGGIDYASRRAIQTAHEGLAAVEGLKDSIYYSSLLGMVDYSTSRAG